MDVRILIYVFYLIFATFGIIFNGFILLVFFWQRRINTSTHILLFHLAILDTLFCFAVILFTSITLSFGSNNVFWFDMSLQTLLQIQQFTWTILSGTLIWTLTGLSCDRYTSICYPFTYSRLVTRKRIFTLITVSWISSFTFSVLPHVFKSIDSASTSSSCTHSLRTIYPATSDGKSDPCLPFSLDPAFLILTLPLSFHSSSFAPFNISLDHNSPQLNVPTFTLVPQSNRTDQPENIAAARHLSSLSQIDASSDVFNLHFNRRSFVWHSCYVFTLITVNLVIPIIIIVTTQIHILLIAKGHRGRIVSISSALHASGGYNCNDNGGDNDTVSSFNDVERCSNNNDSSSGVKCQSSNLHSIVTDGRRCKLKCFTKSAPPSTPATSPASVDDDDTKFSFVNSSVETGKCYSCYVDSESNHAKLTGENVQCDEQFVCQEKSFHHNNNYSVDTMSSIRSHSRKFVTIDNANDASDATCPHETLSENNGHQTANLKRIAQVMNNNNTNHRTSDDSRCDCRGKRSNRLNRKCKSLDSYSYQRSSSRSDQRKVNVKDTEECNNNLHESMKQECQINVDIDHCSSGCDSSDSSLSSSYTSLSRDSTASPMDPSSSRHSRSTRHHHHRHHHKGKYGHIFHRQHRTGIATVAIFIASLILLWIPWYAIHIVEALIFISVADTYEQPSYYLTMHSFVLLTIVSMSFTLIPTVNAYVFGVKSRQLRQTFKRLLQRYIYKHKASIEISRRLSLRSQSINSTGTKFSFIGWHNFIRPSSLPASIIVNSASKMKKRRNSAPCSINQSTSGSNCYLRTSPSPLPTILSDSRSISISMTDTELVNLDSGTGASVSTGHSKESSIAPAERASSSTSSSCPATNGPKKCLTISHSSSCSSSQTGKTVTFAAGRRYSVQVVTPVVLSAVSCIDFSTFAPSTKRSCMKRSSIANDPPDSKRMQCIREATKDYNLRLSGSSEPSAESAAGATSYQLPLSNITHYDCKLTIDEDNECTNADHSSHGVVTGTTNGYPMHDDYFVDGEEDEVARNKMNATAYVPCVSRHRYLGYGDDTPSASMSTDEPAHGLQAALQIDPSQRPDDLLLSNSKITCQRQKQIQRQQQQSQSVSTLQNCNLSLTDCATSSSSSSSSLSSCSSSPSSSLCSSSSASCKSLERNLSSNLFHSKFLSALNNSSQSPKPITVSQSPPLGLINCRLSCAVNRQNASMKVRSRKLSQQLRDKYLTNSLLTQTPFKSIHVKKIDSMDTYSREAEQTASDSLDISNPSNSRFNGQFILSPIYEKPNFVISSPTICDV